MGLDSHGLMILASPMTLKISIVFSRYSLSFEIISTDCLCVLDMLVSDFKAILLQEALNQIPEISY